MKRNLPVRYNIDITFFCISACMKELSICSIVLVEYLILQSFSCNLKMYNSFMEFFFFFGEGRISLWWLDIHLQFCMFFSHPRKDIWKNWVFCGFWVLNWVVVFGSSAIGGHNEYGIRRPIRYSVDGYFLHLHRFHLQWVFLGTLWNLWKVSLQVSRPIFEYCKLHVSASLICLYLSYAVFFFPPSINIELFGQIWQKIAKLLEFLHWKKKSKIFPIFLLMGAGLVMIIWQGCIDSRVNKILRNSIPIRSWSSVAWVTVWASISQFHENEDVDSVGYCSNESRDHPQLLQCQVLPQCYWHLVSRQQQTNLTHPTHLHILRWWKRKIDDRTDMGLNHFVSI